MPAAMGLLAATATQAVLCHAVLCHAVHWDRRGETQELLEAARASGNVDDMRKYSQRMIDVCAWGRSLM
jgi:hypothetical protein